jgi:hypothetical protein
MKGDWTQGRSCNRVTEPITRKAERYFAEIENAIEKDRINKTFKYARRKRLCHKRQSNIPKLAACKKINKHM